MKETRAGVLAGLIRKNGWKRGAELGLWHGQTYGYLLEHFPNLEMIGVDNWRPDGPYFGKDMAAAEAKCRALDVKYGARSVLLKTDTVTAALEVPDGALDFVFIDASHDTDSVLADIRAWRAKVRAGGALIGHDADWPTVRDALREALPGWKTLGANVWFFPCK